MNPKRYVQSESDLLGQLPDILIVNNIEDKNIKEEKKRHKERYNHFRYNFPDQKKCYRQYFPLWSFLFPQVN